MRSGKCCARGRFPFRKLKPHCGELAVTPVLEPLVRFSFVFCYATRGISYDYQTKDITKIGVWKYSETQALRFLSLCRMSSDEGEIPKTGPTDIRRVIYQRTYTMSRDKKGPVKAEAQKMRRGPTRGALAG